MNVKFTNNYVTVDNNNIIYKVQNIVNLKSDNNEEQNLTTRCVLKVPILASIVFDDGSDHVAVVVNE